MNRKMIKDNKKISNFERCMYATEVQSNLIVKT